MLLLLKKLRVNVHWSTNVVHIRANFRKCLLYGLSFALLSTALLPVYSVKASTIFDDTYQKANKLEVSKSNYYGANIDPVVITQDYAKYITDEQYWHMRGDSNRPLFEQWSNSFKKALTSGRWGVSQVRTMDGGGYIDTVKVFWTEDTSLKLDWREFYGTKTIYAKSDTSALRVAIIYPDTGSRYETQPQGPKLFSLRGGDIGSATAVSVSPDTAVSQGEAVSNLFVYTDYPNYPQAYNGQQIPNSNVTKNKAYPDIMYSVDNFDLRWYYMGNIEKHTEWKNFNIKYTLKNENGEVVFEEVSEKNTPHEYTTDKYGTWTLTAKPVVKVPFTIPENIDIKTATMPIRIDGSTYMSTKKDMKCDENGVCEAVSPLMDCSQFAKMDGFDDFSVGKAVKMLTLTFGCHFNNIYVQIKAFLMSAVIPSPRWLTDFGKISKDWFEDQFGALYEATNIMISQLNSIINPTPNGKLVATGTYFNKTHTFGIDLTKMQNTMPIIYNVIINLCRALFAFGLIFALNRRLFGFLDELKI